MGTSTAYAPGHLTGLFQICDQATDPLQRGARGSGISLDIGVYTKVTAEPADATKWSIKINGKQTDGAFVSENVLSKFSKLMSPHALAVEHFVETPAVAGFGSSGGGALSLALALNEATGAGLTSVEAAQIAHVAEIECKTGLGSVFAAVRGGFGVLTKPGAPGVGDAVSYPDQSSLRVVYLYFGPIPTKEALSNPALRAKINEMGGRFVDELAKKPTPEKFMRLSRQFTEHVGLVTPRLRAVFDRMDAEGYTFTMAMFGDVAFSVMEKSRALEAASILERSFPGCEAVVVGIDEEGARITSRSP
ncbi:MAG: GHMP kinase [Candidatus Bathyarchaeota archaeon]|nr:GHMP kinase [Candidatus Bathyarchaeota archaeon]